MNGTKPGFWNVIELYARPFGIVAMLLLAIDHYRHFRWDDWVLSGFVFTSLILGLVVTCRQIFHDATSLRSNR